MHRALFIENIESYTGRSPRSEVTRQQGRRGFERAQVARQVTPKVARQVTQGQELGRF